MILIALFLTLLQIFDAWTTYQVLQIHGKESNPVVEWFLEKFGVVPGLAVIKIFAIALVWILAALQAQFGLLLLTAFYLWVAYNNWKVLKKLRG